MNRDWHGIIGQIQPDLTVEGGDSACWMGHWLYLNDGACPRTDWTTKKYVDWFQVRPGAFVRHPDPAMTYHGFGAYYNGPYDGVISRDQYHGVLAVCIKGHHKDVLWCCIRHHMRWGMLFMYNTRINGQPPTQSKWKWPDFTFMDIWALYIRGLRAWPLYPLLLVFDLQLLLASAVIRTEPVEKDDIINHLIKVIIAKDIMPTPLSFLARLALSRSQVEVKLKKYWCEWRQGCDIVPLYLKKLFS